MARVRHSIFIAVVVSLIAALSAAPAEAQRDVDFIDGWKGGQWSSYAGGDRIPEKETWLAYYATYGRVRNGSEKKLANGVRWRLATDQQTEIAMPRIVWMPDNRNRDVANRMLEMVHGGTMLFSQRQQDGFRQYLKIYEERGAEWSELSEKNRKRHLKAVRELMPSRVVTQSAIALTYASTRYASLIDLGFIFRDEGNYLPRIIRGVTLDLERRQIYTMDACPEGSFKRPGAVSTPVFRFADLLEICDQESLERFSAVVEAADDRTRAATADSNDPLIEDCRGTGIAGGQEVVLYLAVGGLAVHLTEFWPNAAYRSCPLRLSARNPVIVPYRDLEPLMKPGLLREELLKSK